MRHINYKECENAEELLKILEKKEIIIYGTGYVATRFYLTLDNIGIQKNVCCFVTSKGGKEFFRNKPVLSINELKDCSEKIVCIAVHESLKEEIISLLILKGISNYIWIYPFMNELMFGKPIFRNKNIPISQLICDIDDHYWLAVRYIAIDNYYKKNSNGYEIYLKAISRHCGQITAEKRLKQFVELIQSWEQNGYDNTISIPVLEDNQIIDGRHRVALASYFCQKNITCDIYPLKNNVMSIHDDRVTLSRKQILNMDTEERNLLEEANAKIKKQYK